MSRYRTNVVLTLEFDTDETDPKAFIAKQLDAVLPPYIEFMVANTSKIKSVNKVLGEFGPEDVFPFTSTCERKEYVIGDKTYMVRMDSQRYSVFAQNRKCVACGLEGTILLLEMPSEATQPHFNFYAKEHGQLVLMTKDHIRSKAYGGGDTHENFQTMCAICNCLKGSTHLTIEGVAELRCIYNENRRGGSKKQLAMKIRKAKQRLVIPLKPGEREQHHLSKMRAAKLAEDKSSCHCLIAVTNLFVYEGSGRLYACEDDDLGITATGQLIGQISAGQKVKPTGDYRQRKISIIYEGKHVWVYHGLFDYSKT